MAMQGDAPGFNRTQPLNDSTHQIILIPSSPMLPPNPLNIDARGATVNSVGGDQFNIDNVDLSTHNTTHNNNGDTTFNSANNAVFYITYANGSSGDLVG